MEIVALTLPMLPLIALAVYCAWLGTDRARRVARACRLSTLLYAALVAWFLVIDLDQRTERINADLAALRANPEVFVSHWLNAGPYGVLPQNIGASSWQVTHATRTNLVLVSERFPRYGCPAMLLHDSTVNLRNDATGSIDAIVRVMVSCYKGQVVIVMRQDRAPVLI